MSTKEPHGQIRNLLRAFRREVLDAAAQAEGFKSYADSDWSVALLDISAWAERFVGESPAPPAPSVATVRVRVAVAVDSARQWCAYGDGGSTDNEVRAAAMNDLEGYSPDEPIVTHWIEADLAIPSEQTVEAEVSPG